MSDAMPYHVRVLDALDDVLAEVHHSTEKHGVQDHLPDGTNRLGDYLDAQLARDLCNEAAAQRRVTWRHIADEEVAEANAETDPAALRAELVQCAAVYVKWIAAIDGRTNQ